MLPRPYTFVINIGKGTHGALYVHAFQLGCVDLVPQRRGASFKLHIGLEKVTQGLARATSHRVLAPVAGTSPRYSIPFFQNLAQDVRLSEHVLQCTSSLRFSFRYTKKNLLFLSLSYLLYAVGQSLLKCSSSEGVVASSARQRVSRITESAPPS